MPENNENPVVEQEPAVGEAAVNKLRPKLLAMAASEVRPVNLDPNDAALKALALAMVVCDPELKPFFLSLPDLAFDKSQLDDLEPAGRAVIHTRAHLDTLIATKGRVKVPLAMIERASGLRGCMLKVLEYNLDDDAEVQRELVHIRRGSGRFDTSTDLSALARLYREHAPLLAGDTRQYRAEDAAEATQLAASILDSLGQGKLDPDRELATRAFSFMVRTYEDVRATGLWLLRGDPRASKLFPSLYQKSRRRSPATPASSTPSEQ